MAGIVAFSSTTRRSFYRVGILAALQAASAFGQVPAPTTSETELTLRVCRSGPAQQTSQAARQLGSAQVGAVEPLENPTLVVTHQQTLEGEKEWETVAGAKIRLPLSGRRGVLRDAARAREQALGARASADVLDSALAFREAYAVAVLEHERARVLRARQAALEDLASVQKELKARGEVAEYDVRRHQAEVRLHARALDGARARAERAARRLTYWLGEPIELRALTAASLDRTPLTVFGGDRHPEVSALHAEASAADLESRAAQRRTIPEPELFVGYRQIGIANAVGHGVSLGLELPLPFLDHGQGARARASAEHALVEARAERLERELDSELQATRGSLQPLEEALGRAEQTETDSKLLEANARALYSAGEASIAELLDAYRTAESAALDRLNALEELVEARLEVMRAAGRQFDAELDRNCGNAGSAPR